ncbi:MAG: ATPase, T2SS/T4P/T4SS family, partial [candidate division NC10 bacterium]|nr:ATPase, T2SS/T4P/T4SS family [candidate division NC10 bacterium]
MELRDLLKTAVERKASDLHIKVGSPPVIRIDNKLIPLTEKPRLSQEETMRIVLSVMNNNQREHFKEKREIDLAYSVPGLGRFRVNIFQQRSTIGMVMRIIPMKVSTIQDLNMPPVVEKLALETRGLILVTGATGTGKSTTLAAMVEHINTNRTAHIITIEDPIEFLIRDKMALVNQREVGADTESFPEALR